MIRPEPHAPLVNRRYRRNFWARNVAFPTTEHKALIWAAIRVAMHIPDSPAGGERP